MDISAVYFPSAVALGALHALEPGHAKTLTAAYLIGTKGTARDAVLLGLSVATTHSMVVVLLSVGAVLLGREAFTDEAMYWLGVASGGIVIALGAWLLRRRLRAMRRTTAAGHAHSHAPDPQVVAGRHGHGVIEIIDTPAGERMRLTLDTHEVGRSVRVEIDRQGGRLEVLELASHDPGSFVWTSAVAPEEPHEFQARIVLTDKQRVETLPFAVREPDHGHGHDHRSGRAEMSEDEHVRAHAAALPAYVASGERPTVLQVIAFGAAGGLMPCPAAVTVMLLSIAAAKTASGLFLVAGFSLGLATTLVAIGIAVVLGLSRLSGAGRLSWLSRQAPVISAALVMVSGAAGLLLSVAKGA